MVQAFRSYGDTWTSHDSKNRCETWLLLELQDRISRSINIHRDTHTLSLYTQLWWSHFLPVCSNPNHDFLFYPMRNAFYHVTQWWWWCCCLRGRGGGSVSDSCFPSALTQLQSASHNLTGLEQPSAAQRCVRGQKYLQLKGHPNLSIISMALISISSLRLSSNMYKSITKSQNESAPSGSH